MLESALDEWETEINQRIRIRSCVVSNVHIGKRSAPITISVRARQGECVYFGMIEADIGCSTE